MYLYTEEAPVTPSVISQATAIISPPENWAFKIQDIQDVVDAKKSEINKWHKEQLEKLDTRNKKKVNDDKYTENTKQD